jgi:hypothetical protein
MDKLLPAEHVNGDVASLAFPPAPEPMDDRGALQNLVLLAWTCHVCAMRGEFLYAQQCLESAVDILLRLLQRYGDGPLRQIPARNPRRRLETLAPALAHELLGVVLGTVDMPEAHILEIAERELKPLSRDLGWDEVAVLRRRMRTA